MAKGTGIDEIMILRYFETGPIEQAQLLFNIVGEKMRERLGGRAEAGGEPAPRGPARKQRPRTSADAPREESAPVQKM
jgi:hypothetical protein